MLENLQVEDGFKSFRMAESHSSLEQVEDMELSVSLGQNVVWERQERRLK